MTLRARGAVGAKDENPTRRDPFGQAGIRIERDWPPRQPRLRIARQLTGDLIGDCRQLRRCKWLAHGSIERLKNRLLRVSKCGVHTVFDDFFEQLAFSFSARSHSLSIVTAVAVMASPVTYSRRQMLIKILAVTAVALFAV